MRFNVSGKTFQTQLQAVSKVINAKNALSILDNFLLQVEGDRLSITGSDQENVMTAYMEITGSESDGKIAIGAKRLLEVVKEVANQPLEIVIDDVTKEVDLRFLNGHFNFMGVDADEFPATRPLDEENTTLMVPAAVLQKGLEKTIFAVSTNPVRPIMMGICVDIHQEDITFVSSDTHKLVRYINSTFRPGTDATFIMPAKAAGILKSVIGKEDVDVKVSFDSKSAVFEVGDFLLSCLFIKGKYPNYNRVIPEDSPFELTVDRQTLLTAVRRVSLFAAKSSSLVALRLTDSGVQINSQDPDYSTSASEFVACEYQGNDMVIGFNGQFMIEILNNMSDETVIVKLADPARPGVYLPLKQEEGENIVILQMPVQVR